MTDLFTAEALQIRAEVSNLIMARRAQLGRPHESANDIYWADHIAGLILANIQGPEQVDLPFVDTNGTRNQTPKRAITMTEEAFAQAVATEAQARVDRLVATDKLLTGQTGPTLPNTTVAPACPHDWTITPGTDGYEQHCTKCNQTRRTP